MIRAASKPLVFVGGVLAGLAAAWLSGLAGQAPRAMAQGYGLSDVGRYQIASGVTSSGAYVLDTRTGDVTYVDSAGNINPLGNAFKKR